MKKDWRVILGFGITAFLLWLVLRDVAFQEVWSEVKETNVLLLLAGVGIGYGNYLLRSVRWGILLRPLASRTTLYSRFAAMNIGFMATNLIPLRFGEFVRPYALSKMEEVSVSGAFGSLVVERFLDSLAIATLLFVAVAAPGFPDNPVVWGISLGVLIRWFLVGLGGLLFFMILFLVFPGPLVAVAERLAGFLPARAQKLVVEILESFVEGLKVLQAPGLLLKAVAWSLVIWVVQASSFWVAFLAFNIHVGFEVALFVNGMVALAVAAPAAPGFIGTFQVGVTAGLGVYGVSHAAAVALSLLFHLCAFIPVTLVGLYFAWKLGLSLAEVGDSDTRVEEAVEDRHRVEALTSKEGQGPPGRSSSHG